MGTSIELMVSGIPRPSAGAGDLEQFQARDWIVARHLGA